MRFKVCEQGLFPTQGKDICFLYPDKWDDYHYKTTFAMHYFDSDGQAHDIGTVKIGCSSVTQRETLRNLPPWVFTALPDRFFSIGQSDRYYENLNKLGPKIRRDILITLHDLAYDLKLFDKVKEESVVRLSLLRDLNPFAVQHQFHRIAHGGVRLTNYDFTYSPTTNPGRADFFSSSKLSFRVIPDSNPPSNIHVLIGRNGIGKTHLLRNMIRSIQSPDNPLGHFEYSPEPGIDGIPFANILCVAFSPFDDFSSITESGEVPYTYIGLDKKAADLIKFIEEEFWTSLKNCVRNPSKNERWKKTLEILKSDPAFDRSNLDSFINTFSQIQSENISPGLQKQIKSIFSNLSSGHKVTLLIVTSCVDKLVERSILFLDEPENHLHPPLLSAFIRALSYLLVDRNGVAIISTHSPVILQEVPRDCVWALRRSESGLISERLEIETFGAGIGTLTSQVFGLEVTESGFHKLLKDAVAKCSDYEEVLESFHGKLGDEAKGILRTLLAIKETGGDSL